MPMKRLIDNQWLQAWLIGKWFGYSSKNMGRVDDGAEARAMPGAAEHFWPNVRITGRGSFLYHQS